eukprot:tig00001127_g7156.t1
MRARSSVTAGYTVPLSLPSGEYVAVVRLASSQCATASFAISGANMADSGLKEESNSAGSNSQLPEACAERDDCRGFTCALPGGEALAGRTGAFAALTRLDLYVPRAPAPVPPPPRPAPPRPAPAPRSSQI